jgi:hypothetical protein
MAFLEKKLLSKKDLFILFGQQAGKRLYDLIYKCCSSCFNKSYTVSLRQNGAGLDPYVEIEFSNSLQVVAAYTYINPGEYLVIFDKNIFNSPYDYATILNNTYYVGPDLFTIQTVPVNQDALLITTYRNGVPSDDVLGNLIATILDIKTF